MRSPYWVVAVALLAARIAAPASQAAPSVEHRRPTPQAPVTRIAFGSCLHQGRPAPALHRILAARPDLMLLIGDNVYADTTDPERMRGAYRALEAREDYRALANDTPILAVWDDHDYGADDAGREFPAKEMAKAILLEHFDEPAASARRERPGLYDAVTLGPPGRRVQVILLDTRWFRSPLAGAPRGYVPNPAPDATLLGDAQWRWLEAELRRPAEVRLLVSSIQVVAEEHPFEKWANFPRERERLLRLLGETNASGVVVLSGDRHRGELSRLVHPAVGYPLYDLTASSLNLPIPGNEPNASRMGPLVLDANFGLIVVDWDAKPPSLRLELRDDRGAVRIARDVPLGALHAR
jgi:alkaline phosphatase D